MLKEKANEQIKNLQQIVAAVQNKIYPILQKD